MKTNVGKNIKKYLINNVSTKALTTGWMAPSATPRSIGIDPLIVISNYVCLILNDN